MNFIYHVCVELIVAGMVVSVGVCVCARNFLVDWLEFLSFVEVVFCIGVLGLRKGGGLWLVGL